MNTNINEALSAIPGVRPIECPQCGLHIVKKDAAVSQRDLDCVDLLNAGTVTGYAKEAYVPRKGDTVNIEFEVGEIHNDGFYVTVYGERERTVLKHEYFLHLHMPKMVLVHRPTPRKITMTEFREQFGEDAVLEEK